MTKLQFLMALQKKLTSLSAQEQEEHLRFYEEMIEDRIEEGLSEEEAVAAVGSSDEIAAQILAGFLDPAQTPRKHKTWVVLLLILGAPLWISLLAAAVSVVVSLYVALWSVVISLWAIFGSLIACALAGVLAGILFAVIGKYLTGIAIAGAGIACAGLSIFLFYGCKAAAAATVALPGKLFFLVRRLFESKEVA